MSISIHDHLTKTPGHFLSAFAFKFVSKSQFFHLKNLIDSDPNLVLDSESKPRITSTDCFSGAFVYKSLSSSYIPPLTGQSFWPVRVILTYFDQDNVKSGGFTFNSHYDFQVECPNAPGALDAIYNLLASQPQ